MLHEIIIYVHGVTPRGQQSHAEPYRRLHEALRKRNPAIPEKFAGAEWGWDPTGGRGTSHQLLGRAEDELGRRAVAAVDAPTDFTVNPLRIAVNKFRDLMIYNFADMFYYVSEDGKNAVRYALARTVVEHLQALKVNLDGGDKVSLTFVAHSAGSVAAFDFLFALFYAPRPVEAFIEPGKVTGGPSQDGPAAATVGGEEVKETMDDVRRLKQLAQAGRLRVRRLFTFGSPITPTAVRSDALLAILAKPDDHSRSNRLDVADYGLTRNDQAFGEPLRGPRWVNLWDKDDPIAWPVEPLVRQAGKEVVDVYVDVSDSVTDTHGAYWDDGTFQREVAERW